MTPDELRALADEMQSNIDEVRIILRGKITVEDKAWFAMHDKAIDYLRACADAQPVPAGWKLVPVEPTPEMLDEGCDVDARAEVIKKYAAMPVIRNPENCCSCGEMLAVQYRAMLAAAPAAPQAEPKRNQPLLDLLAVIHCDGGDHTEAVGIERSIKDALSAVCVLKGKLAQAEPKREPLTALRILEIEADANRKWRDNGRIVEYAVVFTRLIESAHGIGGSDE